MKMNGSHLHFVFVALVEQSLQVSKLRLCSSRSCSGRRHRLLFVIAIQSHSERYVLLEIVFTRHLHLTTSLFTAESVI